MRWHGAPVSILCICLHSLLLSASPSGASRVPRLSSTSSLGVRCSFQQLPVEHRKCLFSGAARLRGGGIGSAAGCGSGGCGSGGCGNKLPRESVTPEAVDQEDGAFTDVAGCGSGGCGSGGSGTTVPRRESPVWVTPEAVKEKKEDGVIEEGPGDLLDAPSSSTPSPPPQDLQPLAKKQEALVLAQRREQRELAKEDVKKRAEGSLVTNDFDEFVDYFINRWLDIQLRSCWRPIFDALRSDTVDEGMEVEDGVGPLTRADFQRIVMSGLEILDDELLEIEIIDLKAAPGYVPPTAEEVERRVARYMTLDTNGDDVVDLHEFCVRFFSFAHAGISADIDHQFRQDYARDPRKVEHDIADKLITFDDTLQNDVRPLLKLIDDALWPLRTPAERAAALIERTPYGELTPYDLMEVARPWDTLIDVGDDGHVNTRTSEEAKVGRMEQEGIRYAIQNDRWEASAVFAEALTGLVAPAKPEAKCEWPSSGSFDLAHVMIGTSGLISDTLTGKPPIPPAPEKEAKRGGGAGFVDVGKQGEAKEGGEGVLPPHVEAGGGEDGGGDLQVPPYWHFWKRDGDEDDMPKHWHRGPLVYSRRGYREDVSPVYLAGLLANRAQLYRQALSAASFKLPQYMDDDGHAGACDQPSREMEDLMAKALDDLDEAELQVWKGYDRETRRWLLRHGLNILEGVVTQRAMCHDLMNHGDCGAEDMTLARDLGSFMSYSMLYQFNPKAIFQQQEPFRPGIGAAAAHCYVPRPQGKGGKGERRVCADSRQPETQILRVPEDYGRMEEAIKVASSCEHSVVIEVRGGSDVRWDEPLHTAGAPLHPDLGMEELESDAEERRFNADRLPDLQAQINHVLRHPPLVTEEEAEEVDLCHMARYVEPVLVTTQDMIYQGFCTMRRPDSDGPPEKLVPYPNMHTFPRKDVMIQVRGPPNARTWGTWVLDKNCLGSFEGLTCSLACGPEDTFIEYETFTFVCLGGSWVFEHVDIRAGGPAGALVTYDSSQVVLRWCGVGGLDDGQYRCHEGLVIRDASFCNISASVLEFCGEGPAGCGTALSVQNQAVVRVNASVFQHNYNHIQIINHPIIRAGNCSFFNHSFALWLAFESAQEGSQLAVENARFYGPVWRNEWRPAILVERNIQRFSRHLQPDAPMPSSNFKPSSPSTVPSPAPSTRH